MNRKVALLALLFAAGPVAAQAHNEAAAGAQLPGQGTHSETPQGAPAPGTAVPEVVHDGKPHGPEAEHGGGHSGEFDPMHHVQDGSTLEFHPFGVVNLPAKGSWMVGPIDMTPTRHVVFLLLTSLILLAILIPAGNAARRREAGQSPGRKRHNMVEALSLYMRDNVVVPNIGHGGEKFAPYLLTLFFFILIANLLGLIPWGATATANIAVTAGLALMTFIVTEVGGMRALGFKGYMKTIVYVPHGLPKPLVPVMAVIMTPVELLGKLAKPFALSVRLMANMTAGHVVLLSLFGVALAFGSLFAAAGPFVMAFMLMFLELFVAFLQAYVFVVLSSVFIGMMQHEH